MRLSYTCSAWTQISIASQPPMSSVASFKTRRCLGEYEHGMPDRSIGVYADWAAGADPLPLGIVHARTGVGGEVLDFTFSDGALADRQVRRHRLDPRLQPVAGPQYPARPRRTFGMLADSSPDRWGRTLIERRFARDKREHRIGPNAHLVESDYLLGVHDAFRSGALRFKLAEDGPFLDEDDRSGAPPLVRIRELEAASRVIENDAGDVAAMDEALNVLLAPGASLGGARPKATVVDEQGALWIAKFPSIADRIDVGAWETVVYELAHRSGIRVTDSAFARYTDAGTTFRARRFDRDPHGERIHFASAMTLTDHSDGDGAETGASYLDIVEVLMSQGASTNNDLAELWRRIVFNIAVSNTDDHLQNHGFLLTTNGWRLSPAYDMNPVPNATGLALNIDERDNALDFDLARSVAGLFRIDVAKQREIVGRIREAVADWRTIASSLHIARGEQDRMESAFCAPEA